MGVLKSLLERYPRAPTQKELQVVEDLELKQQLEDEFQNMFKQEEDDWIKFTIIIVATYYMLRVLRT